MPALISGPGAPTGVAHAEPPRKTRKNRLLNIFISLSTKVDLVRERAD
jgi:hypothetical protein